MSSTIDAVPGTNFSHNTSRTIPDLGQRALHPISVPCRRTLLVGRDTSWGVHLLRTLENCGSEVSLTPALHVKLKFVRESAYSLVLIDSTVTPELRRQIVSGLIASDASIFYAYPVEHDCWWVPVLQAGKDCYGDPAFRTRQLLSELEHILGGGNLDISCRFATSSVK
jgi:hypothetical protein